MYLLESNRMAGTVYCTCWKAAGLLEQSTVPAGEQPDDRNSQMYLLESNRMTGTVYCTCWKAAG